MDLRSLGLAAAMTATALLGTAAPAAPAPTTEADLVGVVTVDRDDPTRATVTARYRCSGEGSLWVSVKQAPDLTADPRLSLEGSSSFARAMSHSHRNAVTCDGRWHLQRLTVDQVEWGHGDLTKGEAYVQFCLFDDEYPMPSTPEGHGEPLSQNEFLHVR